MEHRSMAITYHHAQDIEKQIRDIVRKLGMTHIDSDRILCLRSHGSKAKKSFARSYKFSKARRGKLGVKSQYAVEVISENFDTLSKAAKTKTLIHELLHIPKTFRDRFKDHKQVSRAEVEKSYSQLQYHRA